MVISTATIWEIT